MPVEEANQHHHEGESREVKLMPCSAESGNQTPDECRAEYHKPEYVVFEGFHNTVILQRISTT